MLPERKSFQLIRTACSNGSLQTVQHFILLSGHNIRSLRVLLGLWRKGRTSIFSCEGWGRQEETSDRNKQLHHEEKAKAKCIYTPLSWCNWSRDAGKGSLIYSCTAEQRRMQFNCKCLTLTKVEHSSQFLNIKTHWKKHFNLDFFRKAREHAP